MKFFRIGATLSLAVLAAMLFADRSYAQSYLGLELSNNAITDVFTDPAFVVNDDDYQINVIGASGYVGNNAYYLDKAGIGSIFGGVSNPYFSQSSSKNTKVIYGNADILGPSASFKLKKKYYVAVTTRLRYLLNMDGLNNNAFRLMGSQPADTTKQYNLNNTSFNNQLFAQVGVSYGGIIAQNDENKFTGGITLNYIVGYAAAAFTIPQGYFKVNQNNSVYDMAGNANVAFTPYANTWLSKGAPLSKFASTPMGSGLGADMGVVYEYAPIEGMQQSHHYLLRLSASITDIGGVSYTSSTTTGSYTVRDTNLLVSSVSKDPTKTYSQSINKLLEDSIVNQTGHSNKFKMHLPTAMHLGMDVELEPKVYLNVATLINLRKASASDYGSHYATSFTMAFRYEMKNFAFGVPFSVNVYKQAGLGAVIYAGPFYIGTTSLLSSILNSNITNADVYAGLRFVFNKKKNDY